MEKKTQLKTSDFVIITSAIVTMIYYGNLFLKKEALPFDESQKHEVQNTQPQNTQLQNTQPQDKQPQDTQPQEQDVKVEQQKVKVSNNTSTNTKTIPVKQEATSTSINIINNVNVEARKDTPVTQNPLTQTPITQVVQPVAQPVVDLTELVSWNAESYSSFNMNPEGSMIADKTFTYKFTPITKGGALDSVVSCTMSFWYKSGANYILSDAYAKQDMIKQDDGSFKLTITNKDEQWGVYIDKLNYSVSCKTKSGKEYIK